MPEDTNAWKQVSSYKCKQHRTDDDCILRDSKLVSTVSRKGRRCVNIKRENCTALKDAISFFIIGKEYHISEATSDVMCATNMREDAERGI